MSDIATALRVLANGGSFVLFRPPPTLDGRLRMLIPAGLCRVEIEHDDDGEWIDAAAQLDLSADGEILCTLYRRGCTPRACRITSGGTPWIRDRCFDGPLTTAWGYPIASALLAALRAAVGIEAVL